MIFQLLGRTIRAGVLRQASRVDESVVFRSNRPFNGVSPIPQASHAFFGNVGMMIGLARATGNIPLSYAMSLRSYINSGSQSEANQSGGNVADGINSATGRSYMNSGSQSEVARGLSRDDSPAMSWGNQSGGTVVDGRNSNTGRPQFGSYMSSGSQSEVARGVSRDDRPAMSWGNQSGGTGMEGIQSAIGDPQSGNYMSSGPAMSWGNQSGGSMADWRYNAFGRPPFDRPQLETNASIVHIKLKRNNSFVTITDSKGNKKRPTVTAGVMAKKGGKVARYSGEAAAEHMGHVARKMKVKSVVVKVNGFTFFRKKRDAIMAFKDGYSNSRGGINPIVYIEDTTRKPHNGCRRKKQRRI